MRPIIKFKYNKARCPLCLADNGSRKWYESVRAIWKHFDQDHSYGGVFLYTVSFTSTVKGNYPFTIHGYCSCGCGESIRFPTLTATTPFMPNHGPPYYLSGHRSRIIPNPGNFEKGHTPWNKGSKGICKPNSGSFKKGHVPPQERGGRYTNPDGQNYEWNGEYQPSGVRMYRAVSRRIMEEKLGRKLTASEVVIHLDNNSSNDEPINLKVISRAENAIRNRWGNYKAPPKVKKIVKVRKVGRPKKIKKQTEPKVIAKPIKTTFKIVESAKRPVSLFCPKCGTLMPPKSPCPRC